MRGGSPNGWPSGDRLAGVRTIWHSGRRQVGEIDGRCDVEASAHQQRLSAAARRRWLFGGGAEECDAGERSSSRAGELPRGAPSDARSGSRSGSEGGSGRGTHGHGTSVVSGWPWRGSITSGAPPPGDRRYGAFICYCRDEAGSDARYLHDRLSAALARSVLLDPNDDDSPQAALGEGVLQASAVVFLQTQRVLTRPAALLELFVAVTHGVPIVPVLIEGGGYSFECAKALLTDLAHSLRQLDPSALAELEERLRPLDATVEELAAALLEVVPNKIAVTFPPSGTDNQVAAAVADIVEKIHKAGLPLRSVVDVPEAQAG